MIDQLAVARVRKEDDNTKVSPVDLLQMVLSDLQERKLISDGLMILSVNRPKDGAWDTDSYRCGMTRVDEIAFLEMAKEKVITKWRNGQ